MFGSLGSRWLLFGDLPAGHAGGKAERIHRSLAARWDPSWSPVLQSPSPMEGPNQAHLSLSWGGYWFYDGGVSS